MFSPPNILIKKIGEIGLSYNFDVSLFEFLQLNPTSYFPKINSFKMKISIFHAKTKNQKSALFSPFLSLSFRSEIEHEYNLF